MKSQNKVTKFLLSAMFALSALIVTAMPTAVMAETFDGSTILEFSDNPCTLSGDSTPDVTITTTTTAEGATAELISEGKVMIELATDGIGNPVPAASAVTWVALNDPGVNPDEFGVTTLDVDLDALGFVCGTVGGFRAHYITGGGKDKVGTHFSEEVDLTAICNCEWMGESAWADGIRYVDQGNWATYTPYVADSTVTLFAGQTMDAGTVHFSEAVGGYVTITITLNEGWRFEDVDENVKIQDYADAPSGNPSPGLFDSKDYAIESPFSIDVPENSFYGVHLDVEWEYCD